MAPSLRRNLLRLALVVSAASTTGCAGLLANTVAALDMAAGTQYYDFSEAWDDRVVCNDGRDLGYVRTYHGMVSNYRYVYYYNASTIPLTVYVNWSDGTRDAETIAPRSYTSRRFERYATITGRGGHSGTCPPRR